MHPFRLKTAILIALLSAGSANAQAPEKTAATDPVAQITALEKEMEALYNSPEFPKNPALVHPYFSPDMTLIDIMEPARFEGAEMWKHADEIGATFQGKVEFRNLKVHATRDMGYVEYIQYFTGTDVNGQPFEMNLYTTDIWQNDNGKWQMVHQHVTLPMDQATMVKVMAPKTK